MEVVSMRMQSLNILLATWNTYVGNVVHFCFNMNNSKTLTKNQKMCSYSLCCSYGSVQVQPVSEPPGLLRTLLSGNSSTSHFMQNVWAYNSAFAFASTTLTGHEFAFQGKGPYCFSINGQVYHTITQLLPKPGCCPQIFTALSI